MPATPNTPTITELVHVVAPAGTYYALRATGSKTIEITLRSGDVEHALTGVESLAEALLFIARRVGA